VIAVPPQELAYKVVGIGNCSGLDVNRFKKFCLTPILAERVMPPFVGECFANLECRVVGTRLVSKFNIFILEVLKT
jgi:flavin reductase (DIM6/NTAB) family NADH-FMN oxidoreductase RutF